MCLIKNIELKFDIIEKNIDQKELVSKIWESILVLLDKKISDEDKWHISLLADRRKEKAEIWWEYSNLLSDIKKKILTIFNKELQEEQDNITVWNNIWGISNKVGWWIKTTIFWETKDKIKKKKFKKNTNSTDRIEKETPNNTKTKIDQEKTRTLIKKWINENEHPKRMKEYFKYLQKHTNIDISDISKDNYHTKIEHILFWNKTDKEIKEIKNKLMWYKKDTKFWRYSRMNYLVIDKINSRIERIKNNNSKKKKEKLAENNSWIIKWEMIAVISLLRKFKSNIKRNIDQYNEQTNDKWIMDIKEYLTIQYNKSMLNITDIINNMNLEWDKQRWIKQNLLRKIELWIDVYKDMDEDKIKIGIEMWFLLWDIDEAIKEIKRISK